MLTKNLLRYRIRNGHIHPEFVEPEDATLLTVAEQLIEVFEAAPGQPRNALLESSKHVLDSTPGQIIVKRGLEKLLLDRTEFDTAPNEELIAFRQKLFRRASQILTTQPFPNLEDYQRQLTAAFDEQEPHPGNGNTVSREMNVRDSLQNNDVVYQQQKRLYADLPSCQPALSFNTLSAERLLHRYNCAQVQGLLLHCNTLTLTLADSMTAELRQLFKYLRFNQLLCTIQKEKRENEGKGTELCDKEKNGSTKTSLSSHAKQHSCKTSPEELYRIRVDGPLNLFYQTKRYGMNLANFFVAVLHQPKWTLIADIQFRNQPTYRLCLEESCGIKPISQQFLAYIPEDIQLFQEMLRHKTDAWHISPGSHFLALAGDFYCFPDYELVHNSGVKTAIELFHPWHQGHLIARLNTLDETDNAASAALSRTDVPLILGVSNELAKRTGIAEVLEASAYFSQFGFTFRTVPTMSTLLPILNSLV